MAALIVIKGKDVGLFAPLGKRAVVLGRDPGAGMQLDDERASRKHAQVRWDEPGGYTLTDMTSSNGTFLNGRRIEDPVRLAFGDEIGIADTVVVLSEVVPTDRASALEVVKRASEKARSTLMR
jgi:pSer/pThr/pTyr-binding forkhead associated (FHA) protein